MSLSTLEALLAALHRERTDEGQRKLLSLVEILNFSLEDLQHVPIGSEVRRLARSESASHALRESAQRCSAQWRTLIRSGRYTSIDTCRSDEVPPGRRGRSIEELVASLSALNLPPVPLATELEAILYERAAAAPGRSTAKEERYTSLVSSAAASFLRSPLLQALCAARILTLEMVIDALDDLPSTEHELLRRALGPAASLAKMSSHNTRLATKISDRPTAETRRQALVL